MRGGETERGDGVAAVAVRAEEWTLGWFVGSWWPGVILCVFGSVMMNLGTNVMKLAINARAQQPQDQRVRLSRMPVWVLGFALFGCGTLLNFASFKFAAQSLLSGLSSVQFISQLVFSKFILRERVEKLAYLGVVSIISGSVVLVVYGEHQTKNFGPEELAALYARPPFLWYLIITCTMSCLSWMWYEHLKRTIASTLEDKTPIVERATNQQRYTLALLFATRSGIWGAYAVSLAKSLSMLLSQLVAPQPEHAHPLYTPETYFIIIAFLAAAVYRVLRLNQALKMFDAVYMVPMLNIAWILFASVGGGVYYEEFVDWHARQYAMFAVGFCTILGGVVMLCPRDSGRQQPVTQAEAIYELVNFDELRSPQMASFSKRLMLPATADLGDLDDFALDNSTSVETDCEPAK